MSDWVYERNVGCFLRCSECFKCIHLPSVFWQWINFFHQTFVVLKLQTELCQVSRFFFWNDLIWNSNGWFPSKFQMYLSKCGVINLFGKPNRTSHCKIHSSCVCSFFLILVYLTAVKWFWERKKHSSSTKHFNTEGVESSDTEKTHF